MGYLITGCGSASMSIAIASAPKNEGTSSSPRPSRRRSPSKPESVAISRRGAFQRIRGGWSEASSASPVGGAGGASPGAEPNGVAARLQDAHGGAQLHQRRRLGHTSPRQVLDREMNAVGHGLPESCTAVSQPILPEMPDPLQWRAHRFTGLHALPTSPRQPSASRRTAPRTCQAPLPVRSPAPRRRRRHLDDEFTSRGMRRHRPGRASPHGVEEPESGGGRRRMSVGGLRRPSIT